jgi:hypothetical protein
MLFSRPVALLGAALAMLSGVVADGEPKGPKITNKVYFDVTHGDVKLGRSEFLFDVCIVGLY